MRKRCGKESCFAVFATEEISRETFTLKAKATFSKMAVFEWCNTISNYVEELSWKIKLIELTFFFRNAKVSSIFKTLSIETLLTNFRSATKVYEEKIFVLFNYRLANQGWFSDVLRAKSTKFWRNLFETLDSQELSTQWTDRLPSSLRLKLTIC